MPTNEKLFTKSAFKVALDCPWKLYYYRNPDQYANANVGDDFMEALARGGFQVGELAKIYCGVDEDADLKDLLGYEESLKRTRDLMQCDNVTIAEAAFRFGNLFVRVDILKKRGNEIELIEVKAKSWDSSKDSGHHFSKENKVNPKYRDYIYDVAFQKYVAQLALGEEYNVHAYLMMADKHHTADRDGLNQSFKIVVNKDKRTSAECVASVTKPTSPEHEVLTCMDVDDICNRIIAGTSSEQAQNEAEEKVQRDYEIAMSLYQNKIAERKANGTKRGRLPRRPEKKSVKPIVNHWMQGLVFKDFVKKASEAYCSNKPYSETPALCGTCFKCQFHKTDATPDLKDGKAECWRNVKDYGTKPMVEKMNGVSLSSKRGNWVRAGKYFMEDIVDDMKAIIMKSETKENGLNYCQRQLLQIGMETGNQDILHSYRDSLQGNTYLDVEGLRQEMEKWTFPLHMIDFETTAVALPFYKGMHPYGQVAFQFSHHIIRKEGDGYSIEHVGQYLNEDVSKFPNFDFVRELKRQLEGDNGTIFRYANHENFILNAIAKQLSVSNESDKDDLISFIHLITHDQNRIGERDMVDLLEVVKLYYYNVEEMHGSNSIKQVLPAVLNGSQFLKNKYSQPIYGSQIKSLNIPASDPKAWVTLDANGHVESPYHLLESVGKLIGMNAQQMSMAAKFAEWIEDDDVEINVANGGEALAAYSKLMFCEDNKVMDEALRQALLRYCELDTMSMVFIWEYFNHECSNNGKQSQNKSVCSETCPQVPSRQIDEMTVEVALCPQITLEYHQGFHAFGTHENTLIDFYPLSRELDIQSNIEFSENVQDALIQYLSNPQNVIQLLKYENVETNDGFWFDAHPSSLTITADEYSNTIMIGLGYAPLPFNIPHFYNRQE